MLNPRLSALRRSGGEDQSRRVRIEASALMQTKTHVSMSLQSHFAAHGHCTARQSRSVFAAAKGVPMTRPVTPVHPTGQAPCQPIANRHAAMEPLCTLACKDQMRTQAPCKNGVRPLRPYLRVQVFNAGRRLNVYRMQPARGAGGSYLGAGMQRTQRWPAPHFHHTATHMHGRGSLAWVTGRWAAAYPGAGV